jgi:hypothetical protein
LKALIWIAPVVFLLGALGDLPYGYYQFMRFIVCGCAIACAFFALQSADKVGTAVVAFGCVALLFNPVLPIHLKRDVWAVLDLATAAAFATHGGWTLYTERKAKKNGLR